MGNTLNAGTGKGNAVGFKLSALLKLSDLKSTDKGDKKSTLLHFVVEVVRSNAPRIRKVTALLPIVLPLPLPLPLIPPPYPYPR